MPIGDKDQARIQRNLDRIAAANGTEEDQLAYLASEGFDPQKMVAPQAKQRSLLGKTWAALALPEQMSREGLDMIAEGVKSATPQVEPTGNLVADIALNTPSILTQSAAETTAKVAPGFIGRSALLGYGALKAIGSPLGRLLGRGIAKAAEGISGLENNTPGVLAETANNPGILIRPGTKSTGPLFTEAIESAGPVRKTIGQAPTNRKLVTDAIKIAEEPEPQELIRRALQSGNTKEAERLISEARRIAAQAPLSPNEARIARKALDATKKTLPFAKADSTFPDETFRNYLNTLKGIENQKFADANAAYTQAVKSDALRTFLSTNKYGGTSGFKNIAFLLTNKLAALPLTSPLSQGVMAAGVGTAANNPVLGLVGGAALDEARRMRNRKSTIKP